MIRGVYQSVLDREDANGGAVQTFGELARWHSHVHAIVSDGVFTPDGGFVGLPKLASEPFLKLWGHKPNQRS
ncbi:MAG: transposase [Victivallales bacterium]